MFKRYLNVQDVPKGPSDTLRSRLLGRTHRHRHTHTDRQTGRHTHTSIP